METHLTHCRICRSEISSRCTVCLETRIYKIELQLARLAQYIDGIEGSTPPEGPAV